MHTNQPVGDTPDDLSIRSFLHSRFGMIRGIVWYDSPSEMEIKLDAPVIGRSHEWQKGEIKRFKKEKMMELTKVTITRL